MRLAGVTVLAIAFLGSVLTQIPDPIEPGEPKALPMKTRPPQPATTRKPVIYGDTYIAAIPRCIRTGLSADVFVDIVRRMKCPSGECFSVKVELMNKTTGYIYASNEAFVEAGNPKIISVMVPPELTYKQWNDNYYMRISGRRISGSGPDLDFDNGTYVTLEQRNVTGFLQTDKAIYKPGQTVQYRIFSLFPDLKVNKAVYNVEIRDPKGNRIRNDKDVYDQSGLIKGQLDLSYEPVYGIWQIKAKTQGTTIYKSFEVKEYVLPRIEVIVTPPPFIALTQDTVDVKVTAKYTFGENAKGKLLVTAKIGGWWNWDKTQVQPSLVRQIDEFNGEHTFTFSMKDVRTLHKYLSYYSFTVEANLTETLTGKVTSGKGRATIYTEAEKTEFIQSTASTFKPGLSYTAYAKVSQQDGSPIVESSERLHVVVQQTYYVYQAPGTTTKPKPRPPNITLDDREMRDIQVDSVSFWPGQYRAKTVNVTYVEFEVPTEGVVKIVVPTVPKGAESLQIIATYKGIKRYWYASRAYSPSNSFIQMEVLKELRKPGDRQKIQLKSNTKIDSFSIMVISRGRVVMTREVERRSSTRHAFSFELTSEMAPRAKLIAYYRAKDAEIVPDVVSFNVLNPFKNKVSVGFSAKKVEPGDDVTMTVQADPFSLVATLVLDKKVLLLKSGNDITEEQVTNSLWTFDSCGYFGWWGWGRGGGGILEGGFAIDRRRKKRSFMPWRYPYFGGGRDANSVFSDAGLVVLTDSLLYTHGYTNNRFLDREDELVPEAPGSPVMDNKEGQAEGELKEVDKVRSRFPETWLFLVDSTDVHGQLNVTGKAPDSITAWIATAFAFNDNTGFGISSEPGNLTVVKPFFVNLYMPYSVIRGEEVFIQANVFNYMSTSQTVVVVLRDSPDFKSLDLDVDGDVEEVTGPRRITISVPSDGAKSVVFPIRATEIGEIDITVTAQSTAASDGLTKTLRVKPEGVADEYNYAELIDLRTESDYIATRKIEYPPEVVDGSQRLSVTLVGDVLGTTVENLANLVRMSYGCGEQNMVNFAPTVFVSKYLEGVGQLTPKRRATSVRYIDQGFQRQMRYKHSDGSFSGFGEGHGNGSLWLTAFVAKSFSTATQAGFIDIEEGIFNQAYSFISKHQLKDGSFESTGTVHNTRLKGQSGKGTRALTAFTLTALLENDNVNRNSTFKSVIDRALDFVERYVETTDDLYDLAIGAYALELAGSASADKALIRLEEMATNKDGYTYWSVDVEPKYKWEPPRRRSQAASIEATSYVCLVYASRNDTAKGTNCIAWLISQQNDYGGFVSTQDTVVAVQALSALGSQFNTTTQSGTITVEGGGGSYTFTVDKENRLELQTAWLPVSAKSVTVRGSGRGVFLVSISAKYNVEAALVEPAFKVSAGLIHDTPTAIELRFCATYLPGKASNMANIEIKLPSGFELDSDSKTDLESEETVQRVELYDGHVLLYLDTITNNGVCLVLSASGNGVVNKPKACAVKVFDYYSPEKSGLYFYKMESLNADLCDSHACSNGSCSDICTRRRRK